MKNFEIPNIMSEIKVSINDKENPNRTLEIGDKVIYAAIRRSMNGETRSCYPSVTTIKERTNCGQGRIYAAIDRLVNAKLLIKKKIKLPNGKWSNCYIFPKSEFDKHFEMFTEDFLDLDLPLNVKEYYMDIQSFLYDKDSGVGKCSFSNSEIAKKLGISVPSVKKYNTYLIEHGFLSEETTDQTDQAGLPVVQKNFDLTSLNQADLWVKAVTKQVIDNTEDINNLKQESEELKRKVAALERELSLRRNATNTEASYTF